MELELKKEQFACYQALPQLSENREETTETIVPDYLPDIARIVDASGCLFLRSREIADGKAQVSGTGPHDAFVRGRGRAGDEVV